MLRTKLSNMSAKALHQFHMTYQIATIVIAWTIIVINFLFFLSTPTQNNVLFAIFLLVFVILLFIFQLYINKLITEIAHTLLLEDLNLPKYQEFNYYRHNGQFKLLKKHELQGQFLTDGQVAYLGGDFAKSLSLLESVDMSKVVWYMRDSYEVTKDFYELLNHLY